MTIPPRRAAPTSSSEPEAAEVGRAETPRHSRTIRGAGSVLSDFAAIAGGGATYAVLSFATVLLTTRMLSPAAYGTVATALIGANLINTVSTVWTAPAVRRYGREDLELSGNMARLTWNRAVIVAPLTFLAIAITVALKAAGVLPREMTWPFVGLIIATAVTLIFIGHFQALIETGGRMKVSAIGNVLRQLVYISLLAGFFFFSSRRSAELVLALGVIASLLQISGWLPMVWRTGIRPVAFDRLVLRRILRFSTPVIALTVSQYVIASVDIVVLRAFTNPAAVGHYAVAYQAYNVLSATAIAAPTVFAPLFVSLRMAGRRDVIVRYLRSAVPQILLVMSIIVGLGAALLPIAVPIVFGGAFSSAAKPLALLCIALVLLFGAYLMTPILLLHEQTRQTAMINVVGAVFNIAGDLFTVGVLHMGIVGPALSTACALAYVFAADYALARRIVGANSQFDAMLAVPLLAGVLPALLLPTPIGSATGLIAVVATAITTLAWRRPFTSEDVELIAKLDMPPAVKRVVLKGLAMLPGIN